jgi:GDP-4-dehydro-6-deoxy-D-mannose reductase
MRVLVIGGAGFVGRHLIDYLCMQQDVEIFATKLARQVIDNPNMPQSNIYDLNILDKDEVANVIGAILPNYVINLAAQSSVSYSWEDPGLTANINIIGTINILEGVRKAVPYARTLLVGSSEEYGEVNERDLPIKESTDLCPSNPYAVSKVSQELYAKKYSKAYNLEIVMVRAFNHIGPGQSPKFAISSFAKQIAQIEKGIQKSEILVGNLAAKRDFADVRDIVRGYWDLVRKGISGEVYNIGSGQSYSLQNLLQKMIDMSNKDIAIRIDQSKFRPIDIPELCADITKIKEHINWQPQIDINKTLYDVLAYWRTII